MTYVGPLSLEASAQISKFNIHQLFLPLPSKPHFLPDVALKLFDEKWVKYSTAFDTFAFAFFSLTPFKGESVSKLF